MIGLSLYATVIDSTDLVIDAGGTYTQGLRLLAISWVGVVGGWYALEARLKSFTPGTSQQILCADSDRLRTEPAAELSAEQIERRRLLGAVWDEQRQRLVYRSFC